jgi:DNA invertase Pin-like site-specific DNA recombinase
MHAAIYLRQSQDKANDELAISRQREDCLKLCESRGWEPVEYTDNDTSASRGIRPDYQRMLQDIRAGSIDAVVTWDLDRLHRRPIELEEFITLADERRLALATVGGDADLSTDNGRLFARIKGAVARSEVERKSARQKRAAQQRAEQGRVHSGGRRPFGYRDKMTVHDDEAEIVRDVYSSVLKGSALYAIAAQWNKAGIATTTGRQWTSATLRRMLINPRYAGLRSYRGELLRDGDAQAQWPALVDTDTWEAVQSMLTQSSRRKNFTPGRKFLLTGIALCGVCGNPLGSNTKANYSTYVCKAKNCFAVTRRQDPVDALVVDLVLAYLSRTDAADLLIERDREDIESLRRRERVLMDRLDELAIERADGILDRRAYQVARERVDSQLADVTAKLRGGDRHRLLEDLIKAKEPRKVWKAKNLNQRRAIIQTLMRPRILPAGCGRRFNRDQLVPGWVTAEE